MLVAVGSAFDTQRPFPSSVAIDLRRLAQAPRILGATFRGETAVVLMLDAEGGRWKICLPAFVRGALVCSVAELLELEAALPIRREEVVDR